VVLEVLTFYLLELPLGFILFGVGEKSAILAEFCFPDLDSRVYGNCNDMLDVFLVKIHLSASVLCSLTYHHINYTILLKRLLCRPQFSNI